MIHIINIHQQITSVFVSISLINMENKTIPKQTPEKHQMFVENLEICIMGVD